MYVFVTYARKQMRGVQVRGIRIAEGLPKEEVLFLNTGDDTWLTKFGYKVKNVNLFQFFPDKNLLPPDTKCLIFPDLPTNHPGQTALLLEANSRKIPVVVVDNMYSSPQLTEYAYTNVLSYADKLMLLGLSVLAGKVKDEQITVVPPLIDTPKHTPEEARDYVRKKLNIPEHKKIVLCVSYNEHVLPMVRKLAEKFPHTEFILLGAEATTEKNLRSEQVANAEEIVRLILGSDLVLCKMGYQQMLEVLSLGKPLITLGKEKGLRKWWLDNSLAEVLFDFKTYGVKLETLVDKILHDETFSKHLTGKIKNLHDGSFNAIGKIAEVIKSVQYKPKVFQKVLLLAIEDQNLPQIKKIIQKEPFILPVVISYPFASKRGFRNVSDTHTLADFETEPTNNFIRSDFTCILSLSPHSAHGLTRIVPWYEDFHNTLRFYCIAAGRIIVVGEKTKGYFEDILREVPGEKVEYL